MSDLPPPPAAEPSPAPKHTALLPVIAVAGALALVVVLIGGALWYRNKQAADRYCKVYDETHADLVASVKQGQRGSRASSYSDIQESVARSNELLKQRRDAASGSLRDSWDVIVDGQGGSDASLSEKRANDEAVKAVNDYARDVCHLDGDM